MCRNIRVLLNFEPPTTRDEIEAAALQYVRKVSGLQKPTEKDREAFESSVKDIAALTQRLLTSLTPRGPIRTREGERDKGRERWKRREAAMIAKPRA